ncbi:MAG: transaldolase family protein [Chloroflexota bacterium]
MTNPIQQVQEFGQSIWYDNIRRAMLTSGELGRLLDDGVLGVTSNPAIFEKAIVGSMDYDAALGTLSAAGRDTNAIYEVLVLDDIAAAADRMRSSTFSVMAEAEQVSRVLGNLVHDAIKFTPDGAQI